MACLMAREMGAAGVSIWFGRKPSGEKIGHALKLADAAFDITGAVPLRCVGADQAEEFREGDDGDVDFCEGDKADILIVCGNDLPDWKRVLPLLQRRATIVLMSIVAGGELKMPYMDFILPGHRIIASTECRKDRFEEMLQAVTKPLQHSAFQPMIEEFPMTEEGLEEAFGKLERGEMRFRGVLTVPEGGI